MNILVIGGGGREHALAWKLSRSPKAQKVFVAPGNGGTALDVNLTNIPFNGVTDIAALAEFALANKVELTWWAPRRPWLQAWWTNSAAAACASSAPHGPPRSLKARKRLPRTS